MSTEQLTALTIAVPPAPILENALGYEGRARWIATWWEPGVDEAVVSDGQISVGGNWEGYLIYVRHFAFELEAYNLGSSETQARERLVIDLVERKAYVAHWREAAAWLRAQWPKEELMRLSTEQWKHLKRQTQAEMRTLPAPTLEELQAAYWQQQKAFSALRAWLNRN